MVLCVLIISLVLVLNYYYKPIRYAASCGHEPTFTFKIMDGDRLMKERFYELENGREMMNHSLHLFQSVK